MDGHPDRLARSDIQVDGTRVDYMSVQLSGTVQLLQDLTGTQAVPPSQEASMGSCGWLL